MQQCVPEAVNEVGEGFAVVNVGEIKQSLGQLYSTKLVSNAFRQIGLFLLVMCVCVVLCIVYSISLHFQAGFSISVCVWEQKSIYYGTFQIQDPYRWLEDPDASETAKFVDEQNAVTRPILENCSARPDILARLTELWNFPKYSCPYRRGDKYFFYMNTGLQNHRSVM